MNGCIIIEFSSAVLQQVAVGDRLEGYLPLTGLRYRNGAENHPLAFSLRVEERLAFGNRDLSICSEPKNLNMYLKASETSR